MPRLRTRISAVLAAGVVSAALVAAGPAAAQPKGGTASRGCPVEHEDGSVTYVPVGTQIGLFHCGSDGDWHFGWLTTDLVSQPGGGVKAPVALPTAPIARAIG
jgi:hypothetical protein